MHTRVNLDVKNTLKKFHEIGNAASTTGGLKAVKKLPQFCPTTRQPFTLYSSQRCNHKQSQYQARIRADCLPHFVMLPTCYVLDIPHANKERQRDSLQERKHLYIRLHVYIHIHKLARRCKYMRIITHTHTDRHIHIRLYPHTYTYIHIYIYRYLYIMHTHHREIFLQHCDRQTARYTNVDSYMMHLSIYIYII